MPPKRTRKAESDEESGADEAPAVNTKPLSASATVSVPVPDKQTDADGNTYFEISGKRRITVRSFNGLKLVDIREMYTDKASGELRPGKKGISLSEEQFMGLVNAHGAVTEALNNLDVGSSSKGAKAARTTKSKASSSKESKPESKSESKPASKSKPAAKKKARKEVSEEEEDED